MNQNHQHFKPEIIIQVIEKSKEKEWYFIMSKADFEKYSLEFNKYQNELSELLSSRQQLETQFQENSIVLNEFKNLEDDAKIYKLTGPVLLPQDKSEANINVEKRIEFIKNEM